MTGLVKKENEYIFAKTHYIAPVSREGAVFLFVCYYKNNTLLHYVRITYYKLHFFRYVCRILPGISDFKNKNPNTDCSRIRRLCPYAPAMDQKKPDQDFFRRIKTCSSIGIVSIFWFTRRKISPRHLFRDQGLS